MLYNFGKTTSREICGLKYYGAKEGVGEEAGFGVGGELKVLYIFNSRGKVELKFTVYINLVSEVTPSPSLSTS